MTLKIQDIRKQVRGGNSKRALSQVKNIARHHSATDGGDYFAFGKRWFGQLGWSTGGYHEIILRDGTVQLCYDPNVITNGIANHNTPTYHICVVGNGSFTEAQEKIWNERAAYWMDRLNVPLSRVLGHQEFKGASTACPGINMDKVRKVLGEGKTYTPPKTEVKPVTVTSPVPSKPRTLRYNKDVMLNGEDVKKVQRAVGVKADGWFGPDTDKAVRAYQAGLNLDADGIVGPLTWEAIDAGRKSELKKGSKPVPKPQPSKKKYQLPTKTLRYGAKGNDVRLLQAALNVANFKVGEVDGDFGKKTDNAVRRFQKIYLSLEVDGIAGSNTYRELDKVVN